MQENSWPESSSYNEFDPIDSLLSDLTAEFSDFAEQPPEPESADLPSDRRRQKAAVALVAIWGGTIALHSFAVGVWLIWGFTAVMGVHALRLLLARPNSGHPSIHQPIHPSNQAGESIAAAECPAPHDYPFISLLVAAKNEEAVIGRLVETLCQLNYPSHRYELWMIDDNSSDRTPQVLQTLAEKYPQLRVLRRAANAMGGKSGALNQVLPLTQGEIIGVFDADAQVPADLLQRIVPLFARAQVGAVQVRKAILNADTNFWTAGQSVEMILDAYFQQQRVALGGLGELRGNGQFVRRQALQRCGGWNEQTITDDLDLSLRLHLDNWEIDALIDPAVGEEGVTTALSLWHQRNRWAEGGYQSYLDYWRQILQNRLGTGKSLDLLMFWVTKYLLPTAALPDFVMSLVRNRAPMLMPLTSLMLTLSFVGMVQGLRQVKRLQHQRQTAAADPDLDADVSPADRLIAWEVLRGMVYMLHWLPVVASVTARMAVRAKRLKWVKTVHHGN
jgi:1,2-diacylglycerol 3-beta-glucosyltransferase